MKRHLAMLPVALVLCLASALPAAEKPAAAGAAPERSREVPPGLPKHDVDRNRWRVSERDPLRGFEDGAEGWMIVTPEGLTETVTTEAWASEGRHSLVIPASFPGSATLYKNSTIGAYRWVTVDVRVPEDGPRGITAAWFFKDKDGHWFDQVLTEEPLLPGRDVTLAIDIRGLTGPMSPKGHASSWSELCASDVDTMGLMLMCPERYAGEIYVDNLRGWALEGPDPRPLAITSFQHPRGTVSQHGLFEARFNLTRDFANPFDPEQVSVLGCFSAPGADPVVVSGFYHQDYRRRLTADGEILTPVGPPEWRLRYCPTRPGKHTFFVEVAAGNDRYTSPVRTFTCTKSDHTGFVRLSKRDPYCFEFDSGELFYPIGHNFRSPTDSRCSQILGRETPRDEGTYAYDRILPKMSAASENFVEVWMSSWWLGLEWTRAWKGYRGLGRYNLENAWKLDYVITLARRLGMRVHLVIDNHGKYSTWCDQEWMDSPYNWRNRSSGGFLRAPEEFFGRDAERRPLKGADLKRHEKAWALYRAKARYIMARWGWDPTVMGFEIISELDLVGSRGGFGVSEGPREWHKKAVAYIHSQNPNRHLLTTHYCGDFTNTDIQMARMKEIDYVVGDAYRFDHDPFVHLAVGTDLGRKGDRPHPGWSTHGKPFMITEYGGSPFGTSEEGLIADLHSGIWSSYMTRAGGAPLLWWFELIDRKDLYPHYAALASFHRGEDRRGKKLVPRTVTPEGPEKLGLGSVVLTNGREGYAWVYAREPMRQYPRAGAEGTLCHGVALTVEGCRAGKYDVEVWDTLLGEAVRKDTVPAQGSALKVALPDFVNDCALKFMHVSLREEPRTYPASKRPEKPSYPVRSAPEGAR